MALEPPAFSRRLTAGYLKTKLNNQQKSCIVFPVGVEYGNNVNDPEGLRMRWRYE